jgi:hypothetical protein
MPERMQDADCNDPPVCTIEMMHHALYSIIPTTLAQERSVTLSLTGDATHYNPILPSHYCSEMTISPISCAASCTSSSI